MSDTKISDLTAITGANTAADDDLVIVDTSAAQTKRITRDELKAAVLNTGPLTIGGATTLSDTLAVTGATTLSDTLAAGATTVSGTLAAGATTVSGTLAASGATTLSDTLSVSGDATFSGAVTFSVPIDVSAESMDAIAETKSVTAVDVFVYDTSKDTDGGAWRDRTQATSWYNETLNTATRGARKEFPAVAVIVAEASKVTIYDGDDPDLPMWMVFNQNGGTLGTFWYPSRNASSVSALNGHILIGSDSDTWGGLRQADLIGDKLSRRSAVGLYGYTLVLERNTTQALATVSTAVVDKLVNFLVNDVAMTVLPDAPIDPATGIQVPTIAVATDGGVSVIRDDGTVVDSAYTGDADSISFTDDNGLLFALHSAASNSSLYLAASDVFTSDGWAATTIGGNSGLNGFPLLGTTANDSLFSEGLSQMAQAGGLSRILWNSTENQSLLNYTTSDYNTGWMNGDIKGAFLSDTDDTDVTGGELVTNGTFDTDLSGWTLGGGYQQWVGGTIELADAGGVDGSATQNLNLPVGTTYTVSFDVVVIDPGAYWLVRVLDGVNGGFGGTVGSGSYSFTAKSTSSNNRITLLSAFTNKVRFDNISVKLADADRSVNNNGLIVNGTITKTAVETGADLVAYSGFSLTNYLEQPYNSDLDFGTGDFCMMGWVTAAGTSDWIVDRRDRTGNAWGFHLFVAAGPVLRFDTYENNASSTITASTTLTSAFSHFVALRRNGIMELWVNGNFEGSNGILRDMTTGNSPSLFVGIEGDISSAYSGSLALLRISATAPTAAQITKIYNDERVLFQENAACTLYGSSDAVTALAHDDATNLLHVGTSAGRSTFQGLRRVSNTTTAVGTAISASDNLVVEE